MPANLIDKAAIKELAAKAAGLDKPQGDPRLKEVLNRLLYDVMVAIDDLDVSMNEFWSAIAYIGEAAKANELGLVVAGSAPNTFSICALTKPSAVPASAAARPAPSRGRSTSLVLRW